MALDNYTSANIGGIKRGDRAATGDLEADETQTVDRAGSGAEGGEGTEGHVTADSSALAESAATVPLEPLMPGSDLDELTVKDASDPDLGLTNIGSVPPDDWAADTGPTVSNESVAPSHKR